MRLGQLVYFKHEGVVKIGFIQREIGIDDIIIVCDTIEYQKHCWEIKKIEEQKNE